MDFVILVCVFCWWRFVVVAVLFCFNLIAISQLFYEFGAENVFFTHVMAVNNVFYIPKLFMLQQ